MARTFTNENNYPHWLYHTLTTNQYSKGAYPSDISVTRLIDSPQINQLRFDHADELIEDVKDRVWSLWGSAVHNVVEIANSNNSDVLTEKRFYHDYDGKVVTGQVDVYDVSEKTLYDVKTVSAWNLVGDTKKSWIHQLNVLADLMIENDWSVKRLAIVAICRDWSAKQAREIDNYPNSSIAVIEIPLWSINERHSYIKQQLNRHFKEKHYCTPEERRQSEDKWAVMKEGRKNALKLFDSDEEAMSYIEDLIDPTKSFVQYRKGSPKRCWTYCNVQKFCPQLRAERQEKR